MGKKRITFLVLGIFLILVGLASLITGLGGLGLIMNILAIAAGVMILVFRPGSSKEIGWPVAGVYLVAWGLIDLVGFRFEGIDLVMAILAIAAGALLLLRSKQATKKIGLLLFSIWLILVGVVHFVSLGDLGLVVPIAALASGVLIILEK